MGERRVLETWSLRMREGIEPVAGREWWRTNEIPEQVSITEYLPGVDTLQGNLVPATCQKHTESELDSETSHVAIHIPQYISLGPPATHFPQLKHL